MQEQRTRHSNIAASLRTARHAYNQITTAYQDSKITGAEYTRQIELARITLLSAEQAHGRSKASVDKYKAQVKNATDKVQQITGVASPLRLSATPPVLRNAPPALGQHTDEVLRELGLDAERIAALRAAKAI